jgi:hypothetical protein
MSAHTGTNLQRIFVQYQETTMIPKLEYRSDGTTFSYHWTNVIPGFDMPVRVALGADSTSYTLIRPTAEWQSLPSTLGEAAVVRVDPEFYVTAERVRP